MSAYNGARCDSHVGDVFPPRCADCDTARIERHSGASINASAVAAEIVRDALAAAGVTLDEACEHLGGSRSIAQAKLEGTTELSVSEFIMVAQLVGADPLAWVDELWHHPSLAHA